MSAPSSSRSPAALPSPLARREKVASARSCSLSLRINLPLRRLFRSNRTSARILSAGSRSVRATNIAPQEPVELSEQAEAFLSSGRQPSELRAHSLKKRYRSRVVVKDVSLDVRSGEVIGLLGPNGAGKTTCFYMMVGLVAMDGGELELDGERLTHMPIHARALRGLSYLPQEASIFRRLSVGDNI